MQYLPGEHVTHKLPCVPQAAASGSGQHVSPAQHESQHAPPQRDVPSAPAGVAQSSHPGIGVTSQVLFGPSTDTMHGSLETHSGGVGGSNPTGPGLNRVSSMAVG